MVANNTFHSLLTKFDHNSIVGNKSGEMAIPELWIHGMCSSKAHSILIQLLFLLCVVVCSTLSRECSSRNRLYNGSIKSERLSCVLPRQSAHLHSQSFQRVLFRPNLLYGIHSWYQSLGCQVIKVEWIWHQRSSFSVCRGIRKDDLPSAVPSCWPTSWKYACSSPSQSSKQ